LLLSYKYRLYPNDRQEVLLRITLAHLCDLYNELRGEKVSEYREHKINLSKTDLRKMTLESRRNNPDLGKIHSQVVQNVADRVSYAFNNFFEKRAKFPESRSTKPIAPSPIRSLASI
jgi:putative transposase